MFDDPFNPVNKAHPLPWPRVVGVGCIVSALVLIVWRGALHGDFQFDDYGNIVENRAVRSLWPLDPFVKTGRPLGLYSFALNYHFSQLNPLAYRLVNLLVHVANVILLFAGVQLSARIVHQRSPSPERLASGGLLLATTIALMWGLHPLTTQAVTNIVQRYESLATMGYLGAWVGMLLVLSGGTRETGGGSLIGLLMIVLCSWIGLLSKEIFATAPLVILMFDRCVTGRSFRAIIKEDWLAYLLMISPFIWFVPSVLRWFDPSRSSSMGFGLKSVSAWEYLRTQPEIILHYLKLAIWPDPLCFDYAWRVQQNPVIYFSLGAVILLMLATGIWLYWSGVGTKSGSAVRRQPSPERGIAGWLVLTFFLVLAPTSSIVPISDLCVEHRMYLPLVVVVGGVCLLGTRARMALEANAQRPAVIRAGITLGLISCLALLGWRTELRNRQYRDGITLWNSVLRVRPENPRAWYMQGIEYFGRGEYEKALPFLEKAVSFQVPLGEFHSGLADCLRDLGRTGEAIEHYERAIELKPTLAEAHNGLGVIQHRAHDLESAEASFRTAMELGLPEARYNLAAVLIDQRDYAAAAPLLEEALAEHPHFSLAARRLAWILATAPQQELRDGGRAREVLEAHCQIVGSDSPYVWDTHAAVLAEQNRFHEAVLAAEKSLQLAKEREDSELIAAIRKRLECYRQHQPWREDVSS